MDLQTSPSLANPVVLVPGYRDDASVFARFDAFLRQQQFQTFPLSLMPSDGRVPLQTLAAQVAHFVENTFSPAQPLDFVGFSMGGVVLRYYLQRMDGLQRTRRFVTLGTPHHGTWWAFGSNRPGVRQLRPGSPFLRDLAADAQRLETISFTSIWTPLDLTIVPAHSSAMDVARQERVPIPHHRALVTNRRSLAAVVDALRLPIHPTAGFQPADAPAIPQVAQAICAPSSGAVEPLPI